MAAKYSDIAVKAKLSEDEISGEEGDLIPYLISKTPLSSDEVHTVISEFIFAGVDTVRFCATGIFLSHSEMLGNIFKKHWSNSSPIDLLDMFMKVMCTIPQRKQLYKITTFVKMEIKP